MTNRLELLNDDIKYKIYKKLHQLYMKDIQKELLIKSINVKYSNCYKNMGLKKEYCINYAYCDCCNKKIRNSNKNSYNFLWYIFDDDDDMYMYNDDVYTNEIYDEGDIYHEYVMDRCLCKKCKILIENYDYLYIKNENAIFKIIKDKNSIYYKRNNDFIVYI